MKTHTFDASLAEVFRVDVELLASAAFVNNDTILATITIANQQPGSYVKVSLLRVLDISGSVSTGNQMNVFLNYQTPGVYLVYINNKTGVATAFTGTISLMLEQVISV